MVRFDAMEWTFSPGVPQAVRIEDIPGIEAAVQAKGSSLVSPTPVVANVGTPGSTTYTYELVAVNANGDTLPSSAVSTTTGNATLNGTNYNTVTWTTPVAGASQIKVIRTAGGATQGLIATVPASQGSVSDTGLAATPYTPAGAAVSQWGVAITNTEL